MFLCFFFSIQLSYIFFNAWKSQRKVFGCSVFFFLMTTDQFAGFALWFFFWRVIFSLMLLSLREETFHLLKELKAQSQVLLLLLISSILQFFHRVWHFKVFLTINILHFSHLVADLYEFSFVRKVLWSENEIGMVWHFNFVAYILLVLEYFPTLEAEDVSIAFLSRKRQME